MSVGGSAASQTISCRRFEAEVPRREARRWRSRVMCRRCVLIASHRGGGGAAVYQVVILHHPTTIEVNYQPVVHSGGVRQAAKVVAPLFDGTCKQCARATIHM